MAARPRGTHAFTLIEMVVSLSVISIVFLAMGSVMVLASKALPTADSSTALTFEANDLVQQIVSELQTATSVTAATDKGIAFTVPDRDSDAVDESIMYRWDGVPGGPLFRQYNGGNPVKMFLVWEFQLVYGTAAGVQPPTGPLLSVSITLNAGQDASSRVRTSVTTLNQPQAP